LGENRPCHNAIFFETALRAALAVATGQIEDDSSALMQLSATQTSFPSPEHIRTVPTTLLSRGPGSMSPEWAEDIKDAVDVLTEYLEATLTADVPRLSKVW